MNDILLDEEITHIALEKVLGSRLTRPVSIPETEWVRVFPLLKKNGLLSLDDYRFPLIKPATPFPGKSENSTLIEVSEDRFAISVNNVRLGFSPIKYCLGIVLQDSEEIRRMSAHILFRSLETDKEKNESDCQLITKQIAEYWGSQNPASITFVSPQLGDPRASYQELIINSLGKIYNSQHSSPTVSFVRESDLIR